MAHAHTIRTLGFRAEKPASAPSFSFTELLRTRSAKAPKRAFEQAVGVTQGNFGRLMRKVQRARRFVRAAAARKENGTLNDLSFAAECAPANMFISIYGSLRAMFRKARAGEDTYSLMCVQTATSLLSKRADGTITSRTRYPDPVADADLFNGTVTSRISDALSLHRSISEVVGDAPARLGVGFPPAPR